MEGLAHEGDSDYLCVVATRCPNSYLDLFERFENGRVMLPTDKGRPCRLDDPRVQKFWREESCFEEPLEVCWGLEFLCGTRQKHPIATVVIWNWSEEAVVEHPVPGLHDRPRNGRNSLPGIDFLHLPKTVAEVVPADLALIACSLFTQY